MKSFYTTEQERLSNNIEKLDANKWCSVITMEDPRHIYWVVQNNINKYVPSMLVPTHKMLHLMPIFGFFAPF